MKSGAVKRVSRASHHHERIADHQPTRAGSDRVFGLTGAAIVAALAAAGSIRTGTFQWWPLAFGVFFAACALFVPTVLSPLNRAWTSIGNGLSRFTSPVVLAVVYSVAIVPVAWVMRRTGRDVLALRIDKSASTYWIVRSGEPADMKRQY